MTRREFNLKLAQSAFYVILVSLSAGLIAQLKTRSFKNACPRDYYCLARCPFDAISLDKEGYPQLDKVKCVAWVEELGQFKWRKCGLCLRGCPTRALELYQPPS